MTTSGLSLDQLYESADGTCLLHATERGPHLTLPIGSRQQDRSRTRMGEMCEV